jgi:hypothetical protein
MCFGYSMDKFTDKKNKILLIPDHYTKTLGSIDPIVRTIIFMERTEEFPGYSRFNNKIKKLTKLINLEILIFGSFFNSSITHLSKCKKLTWLAMGWEFNQPIDCLESLNLVHLHLSGQFNHPIDKLPNTIEYLILGWDFSNQICKYPDNLKIFGYWIKNDFQLNNLPNSLDKIILYVEDDEINYNLNIGCNVKEIILNNTNTQNSQSIKIPWEAKLIYNNFTGRYFEFTNFEYDKIITRTKL